MGTLGAQALGADPHGFTVADLADKVHLNTGRDDFTARQAAYCLRNLRGHGLVIKLTDGWVAALKNALEVLNLGKAGSCLQSLR